MSQSATQSIKKSILLRAPRSRVWRAISDAREFGAWFRVQLEGEFMVGQMIHGRITYPGYEHLTMEMLVEAMEPEVYCAFRWHPYAVDAGVDFSAEPTTLVEFRLAEVKGGTLLTLEESGYEHIPAARRDEAFRMNDGGWTEQMTNIERHVCS